MYGISFSSLLFLTFLLIATSNGDEWRPVQRRPTHEYLSPAMDRVHYWQRRPTIDYEHSPLSRPVTTGPSSLYRQQPVPPFMLLPPSLKDSSYLHLWSVKDDPSSNSVDDTPWKWKEESNTIRTSDIPKIQDFTASNPFLEMTSSLMPPPSQEMEPPSSQQPSPAPQMLTTQPTTTTTTQRTTTSTENTVINLVEPMQLVIEGHSKVRKYGVTYLPFELANAPVFKKEESS